jgi:uncharacterized membrane protein YkoI
MRRWQGVVALALGATIVGGGAVSAHANQATTSAHPTSLLASARNRVESLARLVGIEDNAVAPGTLDDGKDLLPQAKISLEQAVAAAQALSTGDLGEVDLEHDHGKLVFKVDVGNRDVKVDATTGDVIGSVSDD